MDTAKNTQVGPQSSASAFTGVTMDFANAVTVVVTRPLMHSMADRAVVRVQAGIVGSFIREQERAARRNAGADNASTASLVRVLNNPIADLAGLPTDDRDNRRAVIVIRAASSPLVGSATRRVACVGMRRAFFPPHSDRVRQPRKSGLTSLRLAMSRTGCFGCADAAPSPACGQSPTPATSAHSTRLWRCLATAGPTSPGVVASSQRPSRLTAYSNHHTPDNDRQENTPARGIVAAQRSRNAGRPILLDVDRLPATLRIPSPTVAQLLESLSCC
jgi:hypothetical protein